MSTSDHTNLDQYPQNKPPLVMLEKTIKWKPKNHELAPNCPRCSSSNTKFCYYNNYSFSQPRYFCKACRRYWTNGGSLRNVPIGGGCRKNRCPRATTPPPSQSSRVDIDVFVSSHDVHLHDSSSMFDQFGKTVDFVYDDFEVEGIFGNELRHEMVWSEPSDLLSFGSTVEKPQDLFEVFADADHQLRLSENRVTDNWNSFDLSEYENF